VTPAAVPPAPLLISVTAQGYDTTNQYDVQVNSPGVVVQPPLAGYEVMADPGMLVSTSGSPGQPQPNRPEM